jgi:murein DD-endopeptidase MepM/ murein hydrolase activator NlpD
MSTLHPRRLSLFLCLGPLGAVAAQAPPPETVVAWRPVVPLQGSLVLLGVRLVAGDTAAVLHGELAGEPLHFERIAGWFRAVGGVPVSAQDSVGGRVIVARGHRRDTLRLTVPVGRRHAPRERLRTAPRFVAPPDSVMPRIEAERALVRRLKHRVHGTPRLWHASFLRPRLSAVTDPFGMERIFNGSLESRHMGVDFAGVTGAPVRAANRGVVMFSGNLYYSGNTIFLDHGGGLFTAYLHLSQFLVAPGDTVARGQVIGRVGATGRVTGPHLHWIAAYGNVTVDPLDLLSLDLDAPLSAPAR